MTNAKLPSVKLTIILALFLAVPYLVKLTLTEPYPAIILPSGHTKLVVSDSTYCAPLRQIHAVDRNTLEYRRVPSDSFLDPAPVRLLAYWERNDFGLKTSERNPVLKDSAVLEEAKLYYKIKLNDLGFLADHFKLIRLERCFDRESKKVIEERQLKETIYELD